MDIHDQPVSADFERNHIFPEVVQGWSKWQIGHDESKNRCSYEHKTPRCRAFKKLLEGTDYLAEQPLKRILIRIYYVLFQKKFLIFYVFQISSSMLLGQQESRE
jgi:hypothetical protein